MEIYVIAAGLFLLACLIVFLVIRSLINKNNQMKGERLLIEKENARLRVSVAKKDEYIDAQNRTIEAYEKLKVDIGDLDEKYHKKKKEYEEAFENDDPVAAALAFSKLYNNKRNS